MIDNPEDLDIMKVKKTTNLLQEANIEAEVISEEPLEENSEEPLEGISEVAQEVVSEVIE